MTIQTSFSFVFIDSNENQSPEHLPDTLLIPEEDEYTSSSEHDDYFDDDSSSCYSDILSLDSEDEDCSEWIEKDLDFDFSIENKRRQIVSSKEALDLVLKENPQLREMIERARQRRELQSCSDTDSIALAEKRVVRRKRRERKSTSTPAC